MYVLSINLSMEDFVSNHRSTYEYNAYIKFILQACMYLHLFGFLTLGPD